MSGLLTFKDEANSTCSRVEEQHEQPRADVLRRFAHFGDRRRLATPVLRSRPAHEHVLEAVDLLRNPSSSISIARLQIRHRLAVGGRIHVDADVVDFGAERLELRGLLRGEGERDQRQADREDRPGNRRRARRAEARRAKASID